jgi:hypothetical protein
MNFEVEVEVACTDAETRVLIPPLSLVSDLFDVNYVVPVGGRGIYVGDPCCDSRLDHT